MKVDALLFDKDGTLFLFESSWESWANAVLLRLAKGSRIRAQDIGKQIGFDLNSARFARDSIIIAGTPEEVTSALALHVDLSRAEIEGVLNEEAARAPQVEATPLGPFLNKLREVGLTLGVATNDAEIPARAHLDTAQVTDQFAFIAGYDSGFGAKPASGQCLAFAKQINIPPDRIAMVGDSLHDLKAGRAAGMQTIAVLTGLAQAHELAPFADVVLADISEITDWVQS